MIRIVVADDNVEFCDILREAIDSEEDLECVACVHDGEAALTAVHQNRPDLLILDHVMPNLDGLGVLEAMAGERSRPRVLMLTAFGQESLIQRASSLGADYYIMKPFDIPTLLGAYGRSLIPAASPQPFSKRGGGSRSSATSPASWPPWGSRLILRGTPTSRTR